MERGEDGSAPSEKNATLSLNVLNASALMEEGEEEVAPGKPLLPRPPASVGRL